MYVNRELQHSNSANLKLLFSEKVKFLVKLQSKLLLYLLQLGGNSTLPECVSEKPARRSRHPLSIIFCEERFSKDEIDVIIERERLLTLVLGSIIFSKLICHLTTLTNVDFVIKRNNLLKIENAKRIVANWTVRRRTQFGEFTFKPVIRRRFARRASERT